MEGYKRIIQMSEGALKAGQSYTLSMLAKAATAIGDIWMRPCTKAYGVIPVSYTHLSDRIFAAGRSYLRGVTRTLVF